MKMPIPDDWSGEDWLCVQIQWPNSDKWIGILAGLITLARRGRFWDERTGSVLSAQQVGALIDNANLPFVDCAGETITTTETIVWRIANAIQEDKEMSLCGYNPSAFKIENGSLWVRDFCGEWVEIGTISGAPPTSDYEYDPDIDLDEQEIYPCGMATAVAELFVDLAGYIWDESDNTLPVYMPYKCQNYIGLDLNNLYTIEAANDALIMKGLVIAYTPVVIDLERSDVIPPKVTEELACYLLPIMPGDGLVDEDLLWGTLGNWISQRFPYAESGNNVFIQAFWGKVKSAIGKGNFADVAKGGAFTDSGECLCPNLDPLEEPTVSGWYFGEPESFTVVCPGGFDFGRSAHFNLALHHAYGSMFTYEYVSGDAINRLKRANDCIGSPDVCFNISNSDSHAVDTQYLQVGNAAYAELESKFDNPVQATMTGKQSDILGSPVANQGDWIEQDLLGQASGDPASVTIKFTHRWLYNINDGTH